MKRFSPIPIPIRLLLAAALGWCGSSLLRASWNEVPAHGSLTEADRFGDQSFVRNLTPYWMRGGLAVAVDGSGNLYQASGNRIAKYDSAGTMLWSRSQTPETVTVGSNPPVQTHFDRWTNNQNNAYLTIRLAASGTDPGELANCYARKIALDGAGDVIVGFLDLWHRDRAVIAKFDGETGEVIWVARSGLPFDADSSNKYVSDLVDLVVLPDGKVAVFESGVTASRWVFTRLVVFSSAGDQSLDELGDPKRLGEVVRSELVRRNDGGANTRDSVGVGLAVDAGGNLYYATHEGAVPAEWPATLDPFPTPDKLIVRKLVPPYTSSPMEVVHESSGVEHWCDLAVGPGGKIYVLGTDQTERPTEEWEDPEFNATPVLAAFDPVSLAESVLNARKNYPGTIIYPGPWGNNSITEWEYWGMKIHVTGTDNGDSLYLVSGERDFRIWPRPILNFDWIAFPPTGGTSAGHSVFKVDAQGGVLWGRDGLPVSDSFIDDADHFYCVGGYSTLTLTKYSANGALQIQEETPNDPGNSISGRSRTAILPSGKIVVAMEQGEDGNSATPFATSLRIFDNPPIALSSQTITFHPSVGDANANQAIPLQAFSSSGLPVSYRIVTGTGEVIGSNLFGRAGGLLEVEAFHPGNEDFLPAAAVKKQFWIFAAKTQTITFNLAPGYRGKLGSKISLRASASSGLPVSFYASNGRIKIVGKVATIRGYGAVTITARVGGNGTYQAAETRKSTVLRKPLRKR